MSKRTKDIRVAKAWLVRQTSYYSGLERGIGLEGKESWGEHGASQSQFGGETGRRICVVVKYID
jgi:hypothetical protein